MDMLKINKIKGMEPARKAKSEMYDYAVSLGLQEGLKQTYHIDKMLQIMEHNKKVMERLTAGDTITPVAASANLGYDDFSRLIPAFVARLNKIETISPEGIEKYDEESVIQDIASRKGIPTIKYSGKNPEYIVIPYWIYDAIIADPYGWYRKKPTFKDIKSYEIFLSLIYYYRKNGFITVRESRFSAFHTFTKG